MILLLASLVALLIGPLTVHFLRPNTILLHILDGFVLVAVSGLVLFHLLPHSVALGGGWAAVAAAGGLLAPLVLGHHEPGVSRGLGILAIPALLGLSIHAFLDGAALISHLHGDSHPGEALPLAVVLHRIPVGLAIWWVVRPAVGSARALGLVGLIAGMTIAGYWVATTSAPGLNLSGLAIFQAMVGGLLLHIIFHHQNIAAPQGKSRLGESLGALLALAMLLVLHEDGLGAQLNSLEAGTMFVQLARASAPALLVGILCAGLLRTFLPDKRGDWLAGAGRLDSILKGIALGLPGLPLVWKTHLPLQELLLGGASASGAFSAVFSARILGLPALLLTMSLLGQYMMLERLIISGILAVVVSWLLSFAMTTPLPQALDDKEEAQRSEPQGLAQRVMMNMYGEFSQAFMPILLGLILASVVEPMVKGGIFAGLNQGLDVVLLTVVGIPGPINAITSTMLAVLFLRKGATLGGVMAFMITGPTTSLATLKTVAALWGRRASWCLGLLVPCAAVIIGLVINMQSPAGTETVFPRGEDPSFALISWVSLAVLGVLSLSTLFQSGVRRLLAEINH